MKGTIWEHLRFAIKRRRPTLTSSCQRSVSVGTLRSDCKDELIRLDWIGSTDNKNLGQMCVFGSEGKPGPHQAADVLSCSS